MSATTRKECLRIVLALSTASATPARKRASDNVQAAVRLTRAAFHQADDVVQRHLPLIQSRGKLACKAGCAHCCQGQQIDVTRAEASTLLDHLQRTVDPAEYRALSERILTAAAASGALDIDRRALERTPCVLLEQATGRCVAYEVRPLTCRKHNSLDAQRCKVGLEQPQTDPHVPYNPTFRMLGEMVEFAHQLVLSRRGHQARPLELSLALAEALGRSR